MSEAWVVLYVFPMTGEAEHLDAARRFVDTYRRFPPDAPHTLCVIANGREPAEAERTILAPLEHRVFVHDDSGWDIGAYLHASREIEAEWMACLGGSSHFTREGWLTRMQEATAERGPALYGASASYEVEAHIRTTGFWCAPDLLRSYPSAVRTYEERYAFEHGPSSLTSHAKSRGVPCLLVTWDGVWEERDWRAPANVFRRGDQSNLLVNDRQTDRYASADARTKARWTRGADAKPTLAGRLLRALRGGRAEGRG